MDVKVSRGLFSKRRGGAPRRGRVEEIMSNTELNLCNIAPYKKDPSASQDMEIVRPIPKACKSCVQNSQTVIKNDDLLRGTRNCFRPETMNKHHPLYVKTMPHFLHFWQLPNLVGEYRIVGAGEIMKASSLLKTVFSMAAVSSSEDTGTAIDGILLPDQRHIVLRFLTSFGIPSVRGWFADFLWRLGGWITGKLLSLFFEVIAVHRGELNLVKSAIQTGLPVLFVPLHRSHLDSFIICWTLLESGLRPPSFLASHSLMQRSLLGSVAKLFGGVGHRGSRVGAVYGYQTPGISAAVFTYFAVLIKAGNSLMFSVEPHRARTGKSSSCALGSELFNVLLGLYKGKEIEDAYIIPVSVNYDILPEEGILDDYKVHSPTGAFMSRSWSFLWNCLNKPRGIARVSFSQPFRLREFQPSTWHSNMNEEIPYNTNPEWVLPVSNGACTTVPGAECDWLEKNGSIPSLSSVHGETDYLESVNSSSEVDALLHHALFDANNSTVIMSTHLLSFLLLNKFRTGVAHGLLLQEMELLRDEVRDIYKRDLGFSGDMKSVLRNAVVLLGPSLVSVETLEGEQFIKPINEKKSLVKLLYYSNHVTSLMVLEGAIAAAIFSMLHPSVLALNTEKFTNSVQQSALTSRALEVCEILKTEFILHPPCMTTLAAVTDAIELMKDHGLLRFKLKKVCNEHDFNADIGANLPEMVTIVQRIDVIMTARAIKKLQLYRDLVTPYLEFYGSASLQLMALISPLEDAEFMGVEDLELRQKIYMGSEELVPNFLSCEMINNDTIRNFLMAMGNIGIVKSYANEATHFKKLFYLTERFNNAKSLRLVSEAILKYCTYTQ